MRRRRVVNVYMLSFAHIMNNEATKSMSMTACAWVRECKLPSAPGEVSVEVLSDRGSTPLISTTMNRSPILDRIIKIGDRFFFLESRTVFDPVQMVWRFIVFLNLFIRCDEDSGTGGSMKVHFLSRMHWLNRVNTWPAQPRTDRRPVILQLRKMFETLDREKYI